MKAILAALLALVLGMGCGGSKKKVAPKSEAKVDATPKTEPEVEAKKPAPPKSAPTKLIADPIVEKGIRETLRKPTGKLIKADLAKVTSLYLGETKITDVGLKEVAKLQQLNFLSLSEIFNCCSF